MREETHGEAATPWATAYAHDLTGRPTTVTYADGPVERFTYTPDSAAATRDTRDGLRLTYGLRRGQPAAAVCRRSRREPLRLMDAAESSYDQLSRAAALPGNESLLSHVAIAHFRVLADVLAQVAPSEGAFLHLLDVVSPDAVIGV
ncbi:MAG TPA: hypothetical protein VFS60_17395 [Thermoanaerobaculia bacterium]|nr:hypothetical protein [Thermoanaerobaculia bacterium]